LADNIKELITEHFSSFILEYGYQFEKEEYSDDNFIVVLHSEIVNIKLQNYYREIYTYSSSPESPADESAIYNVINYESRPNQKLKSWNYFHEIEELFECYNKQIEYTARVLIENYPLLLRFYEQNGLDLRKIALKKYVISAYSDIFKR
jgi:hypothetical protein